MNRTFLDIYKLLITVLGIGIIIFAVLTVNTEKITYQFGILAIFTIVFASKMSLSLPRSTHFLTFSDAMIFLTFIIFGGELAIILASLETLINCLNLKSKGTKFKPLLIPFNIGVSAITLFVCHLTSLYLGHNFQHIETSGLIVDLSILASVQFIATSLILSVYLSNQSNLGFLDIWKEQVFSYSITYIFGAGTAGVIYKLIHYGNFWAVAVTILMVAIIYFAYLKSINELNLSIETAALAEKSKLEVEKQRAEQAEKHIEELNLLVKEQEKISEALLQSKEEFRYAAMYDSLTGLANRQNLLEKLNLQIKLAASEISEGFFFIYIDISKFKSLNDRYGREIGDEFLYASAKRLEKLILQNYLVVRLGSDKFAIILSDTNNLKIATKLTKSILQKLQKPYSIKRHKIQPKFIISIVPFADQTTPEEIIRDADFAVRYAKEKHVPFTVFDKNLRAKYLNNIKLEIDLTQALKNKEFCLYYQPIISLQTGKLIGFEALLRWISKERGFVSPIEFISILEDSGQIIPVTNWILSETVNQLKKWQSISNETKNLMVSVNISGKHLTDDSLVSTVSKTLAKSKIVSSTLKLEITESLAMEDTETTIITLNKLKKLGVQLSIDDFGTGYSSLSQLHKLPFDTLKIDRSFITDATEKQDNFQILQTIVVLAKNLNLRIIAEGIETENQLNLLRELKCEYGQGYLMAKPMSKNDIDKLLLEKDFWLPNSYRTTQPSNQNYFPLPLQNDENLPVF